MRCRKQLSFQLLWPTCLHSMAQHNPCAGTGRVVGWRYHGWDKEEEEGRNTFQQQCWCLLPSTHLCNYSITLLTKSSTFTKTLPGLQSCTISTSPVQDAYCQHSDTGLKVLYFHTRRGINSTCIMAQGNEIYSSAVHSWQDDTFCSPSIESKNSAKQRYSILHLPLPKHILSRGAEESWVTAGNSRTATILNQTSCCVV